MLGRFLSKISVLIDLINMTIILFIIYFLLTVLPNLYLMDLLDFSIGFHLPTFGTASILYWVWLSILTLRSNTQPRRVKFPEIRSPGLLNDAKKIFRPNTNGPSVHLKQCVVLLILGIKNPHMIAYLVYTLGRHFVSDHVRGTGK